MRSEQVTAGDRDYPVVSGINLTFAASVMRVDNQPPNTRLMVDLIYAVSGSAGRGTADGRTSIFSLPGLGRLMLDALRDRDYPVVSGINLTFAASVMAINLMVDLIYAFLDPRVRYR